MPTRVQLPDGSVGEFPDGMSNEQIEGVLQKQFPKQAPPAPKANFTAGGPRPVANMMHNVRDTVVNNLPSIGGIAGGFLGAAAGEGLASVPLGAAGAAAGGALGESARQYFTPEERAKSGTERAKGIAIQGVEQGAADAFGGVLGHVLGPTMKGAISKLYFAGNLGPKEDLELVMPEIAAVERKQPAQTVGDFIGVVGDAKKKIATEVDTAMMHRVPVVGVRNLVPLGAAPADTTPIAARILSLTQQHPSEAVTDPAKLLKIRNRVVKNYSQPRSFGWLNDRRTVLNRELNRFYGLKTPAEKAQYLFQHPEFETDKAEADAIRDVIYPQMDKAARKPPGYFENLQKKRGALMSIEDQAQEHIDQLKTRSKRSAGAPTMDPLSDSPLAPGKVGIYTRMTRLKSRDPLEQADKQVAKAFQHTPMSKARAAAGSQIGRQVMSLPMRMVFNPDEPAKTTDEWQTPQQ